MFAGRMKLNNFILLAAALTAGLIAFAWFSFSGDEAGPRTTPAPVTRPEVPPPVTQAEVPPPTTPPPAVEPPAPAEGGTPPRQVDRITLGFRGKDLRTDKWKDATKGEPYKVNLYQDPGFATTNRAKLDLDRDDKWDEKWTFDGENVVREVAPADDEKYTERYSWTGEAWQKL